MSDERPEGLDWPEHLPPEQVPAPEQPAPEGVELGLPDPGPESAGPAEPNPEGAVALLDRQLLVPIRSSSGEAPEPEQVTVEGMRHGTDDQGLFLAAFSSEAAFEQLGPPGSDRIALPGRDLFERADRAGQRVIVDPGWNGQIEIPAGVLPFLVAGIDLATPGALRARRPLGGLPPLEAPASVPEPFGSELRAALTELTAVEHAWLLRAGTAWTVGVELHPDAPLAEFDVVRNRLHAVATEHLGSRRALVVTDLRAPALRAHYQAAGDPFYTPPAPKGFLSRLFGGS